MSRIWQTSNEFKDLWKVVISKVQNMENFTLLKKNYFFFFLHNWTFYKIIVLSQELTGLRVNECIINEDPRYACFLKLDECRHAYSMFVYRSKSARK